MQCRNKPQCRNVAVTHCCHAALQFINKYSCEFALRLWQPQHRIGGLDEKASPGLIRFHFSPLVTMAATPAVVPIRIKPRRK